MMMVQRNLLFKPGITKRNNYVSMSQKESFMSGILFMMCVVCMFYTPKSFPFFFGSAEGVSELLAATLSSLRFFIYSLVKDPHVDFTKCGH